jgi:hypothetical protein
MITLLIFLAVLGVLVLAHEFGHFYTAKRAGVTVEEFGVCFPPRLGGVWRDASGKYHFVWGNKELPNTNKKTVSANGHFLPVLPASNRLREWGYGRCAFSAE